MALNLTSIENVEFYSGHYLDSVLEGDLKGTFSKWKQAAEDSGTKQPRERLRALGGSFLKARNLASGEGRSGNSAAERWQCARNFHSDLLAALGYERNPGTESLGKDDLCPVLATYGSKAQTDLWIVEAPFRQSDEDSSLDECLFPEQYPSLTDGATASQPPASHDTARKGQPATWRELLDSVIFQTENAPRWVLFLAGDQIYLAERNKWIAGRYLRFNLADLFTRLENDALKAVCGLLHRDVLVPADGACLHDTLEEKSHKHAFAVTGDLKHGVRRSVELLANEAIWYLKESKRAVYANEQIAGQLKDDCVTWLYRLLFLFYVEARGSELDVVPMKSTAYRKGYSLEGLRDLELVALTTEKARNGYYLDASLAQLFKIVNQGYAGQEEDKHATGSFSAFGSEPSLEVHALASPLFDDDRLQILKGIKFRNSVLQQILQNLSLSAEKGGKKRGRISYAQLGISQLGSVYESLLSYTGFFAQEADGLYEVAAKADVEAINKSHAGKGRSREDVATYFIPASQADQYKEEEFVRNEHGQKVVHPKGSYIYTLAGRSREKSASFYTPEVLTQCVVKYSLKELLWEQPSASGAQPKIKLSAAEILDLTICEPAMGSGAFLIEAIDQLADAYLGAIQSERHKQIPSDEYQREKRRVKARLATNNCYGVDLNTMAVRLAQVSLWLGSMYEGGKCPWFGLRLANGNSLVGARREVFQTASVVRRGGKKDPNWLGLVPEAVSLHHGPDGPAVDGNWKARKRPKGTIYHFLLPADGMAAFDKDKVVKDVAPEDAARITTWHKDFIKPFSNPDAARLERMSDAVDQLWTEVVRERQLAISETTDRVPVWGEDRAAGSPASSTDDILIQDQEAMAQALEDSSSAYRRLKLVMDAWCALWFWPIEQSAQLPSRQEWLASLELVLLGKADVPVIKTQGQLFEKLMVQAELPLTGSSAASNVSQPEFETAGGATAVLDETTTRSRIQRLRSLSETFRNRRLDYSESCGLADTEAIVKDSPWLQTVEDVQGILHFHHWELRFAEIFANKGGFDLTVGNPPWVPVYFDEAGLLADFEPTIKVRGMSASSVRDLRPRLLSRNGIRDCYLVESVNQTGLQSYLGYRANDPVLEGGKTNLYKNFITHSWRRGATSGIVGLVHPEGVYADSRGARLRSEVYPRLRLHAGFRNVFSLFDANDHGVLRFGVNVYSVRPGVEPRFRSITNLFHPSTLDCSFRHDGIGPVPGIKNCANEWDVTGHRDRLVLVDSSLLSVFSQLFEEGGGGALEARLPALHSKGEGRILHRFVVQPSKLADALGRHVSTLGWAEHVAQADGRLEAEVFTPRSPWELVYQGAHIHVANPLGGNPRLGVRSRGAYDGADLLSIGRDYLPRSKFRRTNVDGKGIPLYSGVLITDLYRLAARTMVVATNERTLLSAVIPPGPIHIDTCITFACGEGELLRAASLLASLPIDYLVRILGKRHFRSEVARILPSPELGSLGAFADMRIIALNCLNSTYSDLWSRSFRLDFQADRLCRIDRRMPRFSSLSAEWAWATPLRGDLERRQALLEIDVIISMALGLTLGDLVDMYRVHFPVLRNYERTRFFDQNGRRVPNAQTVAGNHAVSLVKLGEALSEQAGYEIAREYSPRNSVTVELLDRSIKLGEKDSAVLGVPERCTVGDIMTTTTVTYYDEERPEGYEVELVGIRYADPGLEPRMERVYPTPWTRCDREEDYRVAWAEFERRSGRTTDAGAQA